MSIRAFLGIRLAPQVQSTLEACEEAIRAESRGWRGEKWVSAQNLHVTVKFLGTMEEESLESVTDAVTRTCGSASEYSLVLGDVQAVPRLRAATMIWATLAEGEEATAGLVAATEAELAPLGIAPESRGFSGHITLARARRPKPIGFEALDAANRVLFATGEREKRMSVRGITLYSSTLTPRGPLYEELAFVPFAG